MQLLCDALAVLGSRHGVLFNPIEHRCGIVRFDPFDAMPELHLRAGVRSAGRERIFPLAPVGEDFDFVDQRLAPCTTRFIGIDGPSALKVTLTVAVPFRAEDFAFSSTPVIALRLEVTRLHGKYRYTECSEEVDQVELFLSFSGPGITTKTSDTAVNLKFRSRRLHQGDPQLAGAAGEWSMQEDRLVTARGSPTKDGFSRWVAPGSGESLDVFWCAHPPTALEVRGERCAFVFQESYPDVQSVAAWALRHGTEIWSAARQLEDRVNAATPSISRRRLLSYTLHSWLINTWLVRRPDGRRWFSVWEGSCYFHSTLDVEYTQAPFYLALWPELLGLQLDAWPEFMKDGRTLLGVAGKGTRFFAHDVGRYAEANAPAYPHDMEVEEAANYVLLTFVHARHTHNVERVRVHGTALRDALRFLLACGHPRTGVPIKGVANTIDDASPAIQYGHEQVYLAVKAYAALRAGAELATDGGFAGLRRRLTARAERILRHIESRGWRGDHYAALLRRDGVVTNPWTNRKESYAEIPGWDAPHIYTTNGLALLDLVGFPSGLDERRLRQDLSTSITRCLREYGCVHTDFDGAAATGNATLLGLAGNSRNPGWISMNMLRDLAAERRGIDVQHLSERYWDWQVVTNSQEPKLFFETFNGNNLCFYPRGVVCWGWLLPKSRSRRKQPT